ncbi:MULTISPECIES: hypothetical protein [Paenibacillus]|uniref:hypothetical protein n=1 Tax=Paenibacillus TaxID=44249 RepID=UPI000BBD5A9C|nr:MULTISPECIES: hypothetical protein [Paenibacillus]PCL93051.1 hypothetical protein CPZ30_06115 [Paenibacillus lautus]WFB61616.1 hypothetical protein P0X86_16010 [Paenibacillus sp. BR1-192]
MRKNNNNSNGKNKKNGKSKKNSLPKLSPAQIAVIVGILTNALEVNSVLVDKDQKVQVLLEGSIRKKTKADKVAEELDDISVSDLIEAYILR